VAALATTLFLGGWRAPWPISVWSGANSGWWGLLWFLAKVLILLFCFVWLRGTLPRIRYDQLMAFGWKVLIPASLAWILMIATIRVWRQHGGSAPVYIVGGAILGGLLLLAWAGDVAAERRRAAAAPATDTAAASEGASGAPASATVAPAPATAGAEAGAGGFPVPPLDLPHYHGVGVTAGPGGTPSDPEAVPRGAVKEVTGA
jgi:NADH-quinone oxidoreductase subunit H